MAQPPRPAPHNSAPEATTPQPNHAPPASAAGGSETPEDLVAKREKEAIEAALHPKDFKLAKEGSKDYVAGQPVDEKELGEVTAEAEKRMKAGHDQKTAGGTTHDKTVQQYGPEGSKGG